MDLIDNLNELDEISSDEELDRRPYLVRERNHYFESLDDVDFFERFRLTKNTFTILLNQIEDQLQYPTNRNHSLAPKDQLLIALRYYATGGTYLMAGDFLGIHRSTAHKIITKVTRVLASLARNCIKFPDNEEEQRQAQQQFYSIARFPRVIGVIDGTFIRLKSPGNDNAEIFRCRKGFFALNIQGIFNSQCQFINVVARWPGSTYDNTIFNNSRIKHRFENGEFGNSLLIGDSGYSLSRYMMVLLQVTQTRAENLFNESLIRTRNVAERAFGIWKKRFPILWKGMEVKVEFAQDIIAACAVLHNICISQNENIPDVPDNFPPENNIRDQLNEEIINEDTRRSLIQNYFRILE